MAAEIAGRMSNEDKEEPLRVVRIVKCWYCDGKGIQKQYRNASSDVLEDRQCFNCKGRGTIKE